MLTPPTKDFDGANLDPRDCDCGKGMCCPLVTPAWADWLADNNLDLDTWLPTATLPTFAVIDTRDGMIITSDVEGAFTTRERAESYARSRNYGTYVAAQSYRVVAIQPVLGADVKPRTGALAE